MALIWLPSSSSRETFGPATGPGGGGGVMVGDGGEGFNWEGIDEECGLVYAMQGVVSRSGSVELCVGRRVWMIELYMSLHAAGVFAIKDIF